MGLGMKADRWCKLSGIGEQPRQVVGKCRGRSVPLRRRFRDRLQTNGIELGRQFTTQLRRPVRLARHDLSEDRRGRTFKRPLASDHLIEHDSHRIHVGRGTDFLMPRLNLFGSHVRRTAHDRAT